MNDVIKVQSAVSKDVVKKNREILEELVKMFPNWRFEFYIKDDKRNVMLYKIFNPLSPQSILNDEKHDYVIYDHACLRSDPFVPEKSIVQVNVSIHEKTPILAAFQDIIDDVRSTEKLEQQINKVKDFILRKEK